MVKCTAAIFFLRWIIPMDCVSASDQAHLLLSESPSEVKSARVIREALMLTPYMSRTPFPWNGVHRTTLKLLHDPSSSSPSKLGFIYPPPINRVQFSLSSGPDISFNILFRRLFFTGFETAWTVAVTRHVFHLLFEAFRIPPCKFLQTPFLEAVRHQLFVFHIFRSIIKLTE